MSENNIMKQIKSVLHLHLPTGGQAIMFGSRARGDARKGSDWDILILLDKDKLETSDYDNVSFPLRMLGWEINEEINPIIYTKKEWAENSFTPFYHNVTEEGVILA